MDSIEVKIKKLADSDDISQAIIEAKEMLANNPDNGDLLFLIGKLLWRSGQRDKAMAYYLKADAVNPDGPAKKALELAKDIDNFFNPDILNP